MQQSTYYKLSEPEYGENPDIAIINGNMDVIDTALNKARIRETDVYNENTSYSVGDFCIYNDGLYKCSGATTGVFDPTKWAATTIAQAFEPRHTWTLLETITADGTTAVYEKTMPDNCTGILIAATMAQGSASGNLYFTVKFDGDTNYTTFAYLAGAISDAGARYFQAKITDEGGLYQGIYSNVVTGTGSGMAMYSRNTYIFLKDKKIKYFRINTSTPVPPSGSTFEIYIRQ